LWTIAAQATLSELPDFLSPESPVEGVLSEEPLDDPPSDVELLDDDVLLEDEELDDVLLLRLSVL
jgi:hypothetical protein